LLDLYLYYINLSLLTLACISKVAAALDVVLILTSKNSHLILLRYQVSGW